MASSNTPYYAAAGGAGPPVVVQGTEVNPVYTKNPAFHDSQAAASPRTPRSLEYSTTSIIDDEEYRKPSAPHRQCRDVIWAVLFYLHVFGIIVTAAVYAPQMASDVAENYTAEWDRRRRLAEDEEDGSMMSPGALVVLLCLTGVVGLMASTLALGVMMRFAATMIQVALIFNIVLFAFLGLVSAAVGALGGALSLWFLSAISAYYAYCVWSRIPFAASNLVTAVTAVRANLGLAFYAYLSLIILFGWSLLWAVSTISTLYVTNGCNPQGDCETDANVALVFLYVISFYWTTQVISNVVHVTTAGTVGTWWFAPADANGCCSSAVRQSYVRAMTYSFGSICLGSLLVAIIQAVKELVHSARDNGDSILACCAECLIACLEALVEYFNKWAFVYVGLYGFSFIESGKNVIQLFRSRGWTTIITDYMLDTVLFMVSLGIGLVTAILAVVMAFAVDNDSATLLTAFGLGFVVGYAMCTTLFSIVSSAVNTVIVCYAEAPAEFQANHPDLSENMRHAWRQAWPTEFRY